MGGRPGRRPDCVAQTGHALAAAQPAPQLHRQRRHQVCMHLWQQKQVVSEHHLWLWRTCCDDMAPQEGSHTHDNPFACLKQQHHLRDLALPAALTRMKAGGKVQPNFSVSTYLHTPHESTGNKSPVSVGAIPACETRNVAPKQDAPM